jgi:hypothetical protein
MAQGCRVLNLDDLPAPTVHSTPMGATMIQPGEEKGASMNRFFTRGVISLSLGTVLAASGAVAGLMLSGPAGAATTSDSCTSLTGTASSQKLAGCKSDVSSTDPAEHGTTETSGTGTVAPGPASGQSTITWSGTFEGGSHVIFGNMKVTAVGGPGQPADETETKKCPTGTQEFVSTSSVVGGTSGDNDIGAIVKSEVCFNSSTGTVSLEPGTKISITESRSS